ncbi:MAG: hypothetical protein QG630_291 [Patescibacteria group bacterium]|nr:hypothetical protein [Patescibacteria group bacterium]
MIKTIEQHKEDLERLAGLAVMGLLPIDENEPGDPLMNAIVAFEEDVVSKDPKYILLKAKKASGEISKEEYRKEYTPLMQSYMRKHGVLYS